MAHGINASAVGKQKGNPMRVGGGERPCRWGRCGDDGMEMGLAKYLCSPKF